MRRLIWIVGATVLLAAPVALGTPAAPSGPGTVIENRGVKLWYEVRGAKTGTPLVLVNGGPGFDHTYELCSDAWDRIARHRPVVMWDQRGNGRSGALAPGQSCKLADQVDDLDAIRAALGSDRIDVIGHSWGGYLAMVYAARHPEHVRRLVICDSASPKWTETDFIFKYIYPEKLEQQGLLDGLDTLGDSTANAASLHVYLGMLFVSQVKRDEFLSHEHELKFSRAVNETLNADLEKRDSWPLLAGLTMPTLVLTGRFDINVAPSTAWKIHKAIPGSRFAVFENSGHMPFFEEPDAFVRTVEGFLDGK